MLLSAMPASVSASNDGNTEGNLCAHHTEHTPECGYIESQEEIPCDSGCTDTDGDGVVDHEESCSYRPAVEGSPCQFVCEICDEDVIEGSGDGAAEDTDKPEENGVTESTANPEENGVTESTANPDGNGVTESTANPEENGVTESTNKLGEPGELTENGEETKKISAWVWIDEQEVLDLENSVLALPGASKEQPALSETVVSLLPTKIEAAVGEVQETVALGEWSCEEYPGDGAYSGSYAFSAALPEGYELAETAKPLTITVELGGATLLDLAEDHYDENGFCTGYQLDDSGNWVNGSCTEDGCTGYQPAALNSEGQYEIGNAGQLYWFAGLINGTLAGVSQNTSANAVLTADIIVNEDVVANGALNAGGTFRVWEPIGLREEKNVNIYFEGTFNGQNHTVSGLYYNEAAGMYAGMFGQNRGTIQNLTVANSCFSAHQYLGGLVASNENGTIENCCVCDSVIEGVGYFQYNTDRERQNAGGIVGYIEGGTITDCNSRSNVIKGSGMSVGGVAGQIFSSAEAAPAKLTDCQNSSSVTSTHDSNTWVGGITGYVRVNGTGTVLVENCSNSGAVTHGAEKLVMLGGIVGGCANKNNASGYAYTAIQILNCTNSGEISGYGYVGGIVGENGNWANGWGGGIIRNCSNSGTVTGASSTGGIVGRFYYGELSDCQNSGAIRGNGGADPGGSKTGIGGIIGTADPWSDLGVKIQSLAVIKNCSNSGSVENDSYAVGGIAGKAQRSVRFENCENSGTITGNKASYYNSSYSTGGVGGIVGEYSLGNDSAGIVSCRNTGTIYGYNNVGGIAGEFSGSSECTPVFEKNYNLGSVTGTWCVGGLLGYTSSTQAQNCYNTGAVSGVKREEFTGKGKLQCIGGLVGQYSIAYTATLTTGSCYNVGTITVDTGALNVGGVVGYVQNRISFEYYYYLDTCIKTSNKYGTPLTAEAMTSDTDWKTNYVNFDSTTPIWTKDTNTSAKWYLPKLDDYSPYLKSQSYVDVAGVTLEPETLTLPVGDTYTLKATLTPEDASETGLRWTSSDPSVATVDAEGKVTAIAPGAAVITVTTAVGGYTDSCVVTVTPHTHQWEYTGSGNVIQAYCTAEDACGYHGIDNALTLTLTAADMEYSGSAREAQVANGISEITGEQAGKITYYQVDAEGAVSGGTEVAEAVNVGYYYASVTLGEKTAVAAFTIRKYDITDRLTVSVETGDGLVYSGSAQEPDVTVTDENGDVVDADRYTAVYTNNKNATTDTSKAKVTISFKDSENYTGTVSGNFAIAPKPITVTATDKTKTYGEADQALTYTAEGLVDGETLEGIILARESGEDAGTYTITASQAEGANPNYDITFKEGTLIIGQLEAELSWENTNLTYNGNAQQPTAFVKNLRFGDTCTVTVTGAQINAGSGYTATAAALSNPNYKLPEAITAVYEIKKADQQAPEVIAYPETVSGRGDGIISGVASSMEYRQEGETSYTAIRETVSEITGLSVGTYYVRYTETANYNASPEVRVTVLAGNKLKVAVPETQIGYTLKADKDEMDWQEDVTLTYELLKGYTETENFRVMANDTDITAEIKENGVYTISKAKESITVTVQGVADITAPDATLSVKTVGWKAFLNKATFGIFFKDNIRFTVSAEDEGSGIKTVEYLIREETFESEDLAKADDTWKSLDWEHGEKTFDIAEAGKNYVYIRVTDAAGNVTVVSSDGGVVVYTDSAADTLAIRYVKTTKEDVTAAIKLNDNTVKAIYNGADLVDRTAYEVDSDGTITFKYMYLNTLAVGEYTLRIAYNPQGESYGEYKDSDGVNINDAPDETTLELTVEKAIITDVSDTTDSVISPQALKNVQTAVTAGNGYGAEILWDCKEDTYDFNTVYTAVLTLTPDDDHEFARTLNGTTGWLVDNENGVVTLTRTFARTRLEKIESVKAPENVVLTEHKAEAEEVIGILPDTVEVELEVNPATRLPVEWRCKDYNTQPGAVNIFTWTVPTSVTDNQYDRNGVALTGTITVTNPDALPVEIAGEDTTVTYEGSVIDLTSLFIIDENAGAASYTVTNGSGEGTQDGSRLTVTRAGTFTVTVNTAAQGLYAPGTKMVTLTVNKGIGVGSVAIEGWTYGEIVNAPVPTSATNGTGNVTYLYESADEAGYNGENAPTDAGSYRVTAAFGENDLYNGFTASDTFTVAKADAKLSVSAVAEKIYGDAAFALEVSKDSDGGLSYESSDETVAVVRNGDVSIVGTGTATITVTAAETANYLRGEASVTITVKPKAVTVTAENKNKIYGEDDPELTWTAEGLVNGDALTGIEVTREAGNDAGSYVIKAEQKIGVNPNYDIQFVDGTLTIGQRTVELNWGNTNVTYNGTEQKPVASAGNLLAGDTCTVTVDGAQTNAGSYTVAATRLSNNNYKLPDDVTAEFTIVPKEITVNITPNEGVYDGDITGAEAELIGVVDIDTVNATLTYTGTANDGTTVYNGVDVPTQAGSYTVTASIMDDNYNLTGVVTAEFVVERADARFAVSPDEAEKTYGDAAFDLIPSYKGDGAVTYTSGNEEVATVDENGTVTLRDAGEASIIAKLAQTANYKGGEITVTITVARKNDTLTVKELAYEVTYGDGDFTVTYETESGNKAAFISSDESVVTVDKDGRVHIVGAGKASITLKTEESKNYNAVSENVSVKVNPKAVTVTADDKTKTYGEDDPELTWTAKGLVEGDTLSDIVVTRADGKDVGEYDITITQTGSVNPNYEITFVPGKLTILPKDIADATVELGDALIANGDMQTQKIRSVTVTNSKGEAMEVTCEVTGNTGKEAGAYVMTITGTGNFTGTITRGFAIAPAADSGSDSDSSDEEDSGSSGARSESAEPLNMTPGTVPPTGDNSAVWLWFVLALLALGGAAAVIFRERRKRKGLNQ